MGSILSDDALAAWAAAAVAMFGVAMSAVVVRAQMRKQWLLHSSELITKMQDEFAGPAMLKRRLAFSQLLQNHIDEKAVDLADDGAVLSTFENMGHLARRGALDIEMIWHAFGWNLTRYYEALTFGKDQLKEARKMHSDPNLYTEFEWLCGQMILLDVMLARTGVAGAWDKVAGKVLTKYTINKELNRMRKSRQEQKARIVDVIRHDSVTAEAQSVDAVVSPTPLADLETDPRSQDERSS